MAATSNRRAIIFGAMAAVAYYLLLDAITPQMPFVDIPLAWRNLWPSSVSGMLSWFGAMDLLASVLSAVPVVVCLMWWLGSGGRKVGLAVGLLVGLGILCKWLLLDPITPRVAIALFISLVAHVIAIPAVFFIVLSDRSGR